MGKFESGKRKLTVAVLGGVLLTCAAVPLAAAAAQPAMMLTPAGSVPSASGPADNFTGRVRVDPLAPANDNINASSAYVTFEPGARSAWHTHPQGQYLIVTAGAGLA